LSSVNPIAPTGSSHNARLRVSECLDVFLRSRYRRQGLGLFLLYLSVIVVPGILLNLPLLLLLPVVVLYAVSAPFWIGGWLILRDRERRSAREFQRL
jgi:hypothetical protein